MSKPTPLPMIPQRQPSEAELEAQAEQQLNQLLTEIRMLESYYQEALARVQAASTALSDSRSAIEAINAMIADPKNEFLLPIGGGLLMPVKDLGVTKLLLSVGAGVVVEKDLDSAKAFLQTRQKELEKALTSLEQQRREIGTRLDQDRAVLRQATGQG
jgi:prefoldin alpha subunit